MRPASNLFVELDKRNQVRSEYSLPSYFFLEILCSLENALVKGIPKNQTVDILLNNFHIFFLYFVLKFSVAVVDLIRKHST